MNACMPPSLSTQPFGGMNIVFCGCPAAQLAPVCTLPICAYYGDTAPRMACFYRFRTIVEPTNHSARQAMTTPKFALVMERADRARDLSDKRDTCVSSEIIRSSLFGMRYLSDKRDTRVSYITHLATVTQR